MKPHRTKSLLGILLLVLLFAVLALLLEMQRSDELQTSLKSGRFEAQYTSAIDTLRSKTKAVGDKLSSNISKGMKLLPTDKLKIGKQPEINSDPDVITDPGLIKLRGIYWNDTMPLADINNRLCQPGDRIVGYILEEIHPYKVILSDLDGTRITNSLIFNTGTTVRLEHRDKPRNPAP